MSTYDSIQQLVLLKPKHYSQIIKRDPVMWAEIKSVPGATIAEKVYRYLHPQTLPTCEHGREQRFISIHKGYGFCGRAGVCACAHSSVSQKVSESKQSLTAQQQQQISNKRQRTNQQRYGVSNTAQTPQARQRHAETYADADRVQQINQQAKNTKLLRYGDAGYNNRSKAQQTLEHAHGVRNPMQIPAVAKKSATTRRKNWDPQVLLCANYDRITANVLDQLELEVLTPREQYHGVASRPEWLFRCIHCNNQFRKRFDYASLPRCKSCYPAQPRYQSKQELEILEYVREIHSGAVISGDRSLIAPYEVDILIPKANLALEFCGLYWHCELSSGRGRLYHRRKMDQLREQGIRLITVFSDEYEQRPHVVKSIIAGLLGANSQPAVHARKCTAAEITAAQAKQFHDCHHVQGSTNTASSHWALIHNSEPVLVMSFRRTGKGTWELSRMSSCARVRGGATKLFEHWVAQVDPVSVTTFADLRWSQGDVYQVMGFQQAGEVPPMQSYVIGYQTRVPKRTFSKARLVAEGHDPKHSEWEILQNQGVDRIWDCGKIKYQWSKV